MRSASCALLFLLSVACASPAPSARPGMQGPPLAPATTFAGGNAIQRSDVPFEQLVAETRRLNKPAFLFFWTSW